MGDEKKSPVFKIRAGNIQLAVWENIQKIKGEDVAFHSVDLKRGYKDKEGEWKDTTSLQKNDIPKAILLLNKAFEHLTVNSDKDK